jgi:hypothetical protein
VSGKIGQQLKVRFASRIYNMDFEWDPEKAKLNESKHGVSFFEACEIFDDDHSSAVRDPVIPSMRRGT